MSNLYARLCKAITNQDYNQINEIIYICSQNPVSQEARELCTKINQDWNNFLNFLSSLYPATESENFVQFIRQIQFQQSEQDFINAYREKFERILQLPRVNPPSRFTEITKDLISLNSSFINTPRFLFKALNEGFTLTLNLPPKNRMNYYTHVVVQAFRLFGQYPTHLNTDDAPHDIFGTALNNFLLCNFSTENLAEILSIHPAKHLADIFQLYLQLSDSISDNEFKRLVLRIKWQDWPYLNKPLDSFEKNILIHHLQEHGLDSLISRAYTLLFRDGEDSFDKARIDPFAIIHQHDPVIKGSIKSLTGATSVVEITYSFFPNHASSAHQPQPQSKIPEDDTSDARLFL